MIRFDPHDPDLLADPYPVYARLRQESPLHRTSLGGQDVWVVSRYDDVAGLFRHPDARMRAPGTDVPTPYRGGPAARMWRNMISMMDPPDHTRLRRLISKPFSRGAVETYRPTVERIVHTTLDDALSQGTMDAVEDLALPIPMRVICGLLGIPETDWPDLWTWTQDFLRIFLPSANTPEEIDAVHDASQHFLDYFGALIDARRHEPHDDLTTRLVEAEDGGDTLTRDELIATLRGLLTAGFETTMGTVAALVLALAWDPEQHRLLAEEPDRVSAAVEEALRWETPVQAQLRHLAHPIELHGVTIWPQEQVWLLMGSANHDESRFPDPERFDVTRTDVEQLAFGGGRHHCVGAPLARLELETTILALAERVHHFELLEHDLPRRDNFQFRTLQRVPVVIHGVGS